MANIAIAKIVLMTKNYLRLTLSAIAAVFLSAATALAVPPVDDFESYDLGWQQPAGFTGYFNIVASPAHSGQRAMDLYGTSRDMIINSTSTAPLAGNVLSSWVYPIDQTRSSTVVFVQNSTGENLCQLAFEWTGTAVKISGNGIAANATIAANQWTQIKFQFNGRQGVRLDYGNGYTDFQQLTAPQNNGYNLAGYCLEPSSPYFRSHFYLDDFTLLDEIIPPALVLPTPPFIEDFESYNLGILQPANYAGYFNVVASPVHTGQRALDLFNIANDITATGSAYPAATLTFWVYSSTSTHSGGTFYLRNSANQDLCALSFKGTAVFGCGVNAILTPNQWHQIQLQWTQTDQIRTAINSVYSDFTAMNPAIDYAPAGYKLESLGDHFYLDDFSIVNDLCTNGQQDAGEAGIDCGGVCTTACKEKFVYIALGDSYQSGEGIGNSLADTEEYKNNAYESGTYTKDVPPTGGNGCHRALNNYAKLSRDKLKPDTEVILIDMTCSGAKIETGEQPPIVGDSDSDIIDPLSHAIAIAKLNEMGLTVNDVDLVTVGMGEMTPNSLTLLQPVWLQI